MKKLFFLSILILSALSGHSQFYNWSQQTGTPGTFNLNYSPHDTLLFHPANDTLSAWQTLPFPFDFFGAPVYGYYASDNGYLTFDSSATVSYNNNDLPPTTGGPNHAIYAYWDDFELQNNTGAVQDNVRAFTYGTAPNRTHVVQWYSVTPYGTGNYHYTAVRFHECGDFDIIQNWSNMSTASGTVGCENAGGTQAVVVTGSPNLGVPGMGASNTDDVLYTFTQASISDEVEAVGVGNPTSSGTAPQTLGLMVRNNGNDTLQTVRLHYSINGGTAQTAVLSPGLAPQATTTLNHPTQWTPSGSGAFNVCMWTDQPNGNPDLRTCNDSLCYQMQITAFDPNCATSTIVVLGSSTAAGAGVSTSDSAWVNRYRAYATGLNPGNQVVNLAVGGYTTYHIMPTGFVPPSGRPSPNVTHNITEALTYNPDAIIINMPSNDAASGVDTLETMANFDSLWAIGQANGVQMFICTTQPRNFSGPNPVLAQVAVRDYIIRTFGDYVLDFWNPFANSSNMLDPTYDSGDGVHMNDYGHLLLFQKVRDKGVLESTIFPVADFTQSNSGATWSFQDQSERASSFHWDFGDGSSDTSANPVHTYSQGGSFTVCLVATNDCASDTVCENISVCIPPSASFTHNSSNRTIDFTPFSTTGGFYWDFGDGSFSNLPAPTHTYNSDGAFQVCLIYADSCASDTICDSVYACLRPIPAFSYTLGQNAYEVDFYDLSQNATGWTWDFGDPLNPNPSYIQTPSHTYPGPGTYNVSLTAENDCGGELTSQVVVLLQSGIGEDELIGMKLYPNPGHGVCQLEIPGGQEVQIELFDLMGRNLSSQVRISQISQEKWKLEAPNLPEGSYQILVSGKNFRTSLPWVTLK